MSALAMDESGPFGLFASVYWEAGWHGVFPLPPERKSPPLDGWTGANAPYASQADVYTWLDVDSVWSGGETYASGNLGIRLPPNVIGIDVDNYDEKRGKETLAQLESQHGPLPETWRVTSRDDGVSGIRLFRVREGLKWPGIAGPGIEIIQARHRYIVAAPSIHPDTHRPYRWLRGDLAVVGEIPNVDELPPLPARWVEGLTKSLLARDITRVTLDRREAMGWLGQGSPDVLCAATRRVLARAQAELGTIGGSRHDAALMGTQALAHLQVEGHTGVLSALALLRQAFEQATGTSARSGEWDRMVQGAVAVAAARKDVSAVDPCSTPFARLTGKAPTVVAMQPVTQLPVAERSTWWGEPLDDVLDGVAPKIVPTLFARSDGKFLFYPARINGVIGESETGKSWIAYAAAAQALSDGLNVLIIDFEDVKSLAVERLRTLNVPDDAIRKRVAYIAPQEAVVWPDLEEMIRQVRPSIIIIDGLNVMMGLHGTSMLDNQDVTLFFKGVLQRIAQDSGAAIVYVDHIPKGDGNNGPASKGGIGAQSKRGLTDGCCLRTHVLGNGPRIGQRGVVRLDVDKERLGIVESYATEGRTIGFALFDSTDGEKLSIVVRVNMPGEDGSEPAIEQKRPTYLMQKMSDYMSDNEAMSPFSQRALTKKESGLGSNEKNLIWTLEVLVREGYVKRTPGQRGSYLHELVRPFSKMIDEAMNRSRSDDNDGDDDDES